jgi:AcrR family transcriptional regulator
MHASESTERTEGDALTPRIDIGSIRRQQIIDAVRRIIAREGLAAVTIARIAQEADVSRGVVTYHFEHKNEILHDVLRAAMRDSNEAGGTLVVEGSASGLASMTERLTELASSDNDWWRIYVAFLAAARTDDFYRAELAWANSHYTDALEKIVGSRERAIIVMAMLQGLTMQRLVDSELPMSAVIPEIAELLSAWQGIGPEDG